MYPESELIPISALQHFVFCPRQCALVHLEQAWAENRLTAQGRLLHTRVHETDDETRPGLRIVRGLAVRSLRLGLVGQADVVEFHQADRGAALPGLDGRWQPYPVEYKRGRPKRDLCDAVQLCAQALCLEEMLGVAIPRAAFFYGQPRRRHEIDLTETLRTETERAIVAVRALFEQDRTPPARYASKCKRCSLYALCLPKTTGVQKRVALYLARALERSPGETKP